MKTKKEILEWWENRGRVKLEDKPNDWKDFQDKIEREIFLIDLMPASKNHWGISIKKKAGWKYPIKLYFYDNECYKIVGF